MNPLKSRSVLLGMFPAPPTTRAVRWPEPPDLASASRRAARQALVERALIDWSLNTLGTPYAATRDQVSAMTASPNDSRDIDTYCSTGSAELWYSLVRRLCEDFGTGTKPDPVAQAAAWRRLRRVKALVKELPQGAT